MHDIESKKLTRPLSIEGEELAKSLSLKEEFEGTNLIYSSMASSSLGSAKYLAERINKKILVDEALNDCKIGNLGNKSLKMVRFMQNHDFNIKLNIICDTNTGNNVVNEVLIVLVKFSLTLLLHISTKPSL